MMKLSIMWQVVDTLGPDGACPLADEILRPWGPDPGSVRFVRASANFICVFRRQGRRQFLRFSAASERPRAAIEAEVRLVAWLDSQGMRVAAPLPSCHGRLVETTDTDLGRFHGVVFAGLPGSHLEVSDCQEAQFRAWGAALGRLHAAMAGYRDPSAAHRETWRDHLALARPLVQGDPALEAEWHLLMEWAGALPDGPEDFGLIHFDFESDNLCWQDGSIGVLDFDDCAHYWYVADIAYALRDLFSAGVDLTHPMFQAFAAGYRGERPVRDDLLVQLPMFLRLHAMYRYGRYSRVLDLPAGREPPTWLRRIQEKLKNGLDAYRASLPQQRRPAEDRVRPTPKRGIQPH